MLSEGHRFLDIKSAIYYLNNKKLHCWITRIYFFDIEVTS